jgi:glycosyltransferase involved in cell wall biosynthesis
VSCATGRKPRVGVNLLWLVPGVVGGSESYATRLLARLCLRDDVEVTAFVLPGFVTRYPALAEAMRIVVAPLPAGRHVVRRVTTENLWLARQLRVQRVDVVHHLGGIVPRSPVPAVVTLHDLQYLAYPQYFSSAKRGYLAMAQGRSLHRARVVTAISEFTRQQAIERFGLDREKVVLVPPVVEARRAPGSPARAAVRERFELAADFVLYPAAMYPHKNHLMLIRAFAQAARGHNVDLVLTGATGAGAWGSAHSTSDAAIALAKELGIAEHVRMLGYLGDNDLAALYSEATVLAFPSRFEGFGLPVVEAMSAGCPVVAADAAALPEVVGAAGILLDPDDTQAWAETIVTLLDDELARQRLAAAGTKRVAELSAADPAETLRGVYRRTALDRKPAPHRRAAQ